MAVQVEVEVKSKKGKRVAFLTRCRTVTNEVLIDGEAVAFISTQM